MNMGIIEDNSKLLFENANLQEENRKLREENSKLQEENCVHRDLLLCQSVNNNSVKVEEYENNVDYYLIRTGYTSRLVNKLGYIETATSDKGVTIISNEITPLCTRVLSQDEMDEEFDLEMEELYSEDVQDNINYLLKRMLFIKDGLGGSRGTYVVKEAEYIYKNIINILDQTEVDYDGTICLYGGKSFGVTLGKVLRCVNILSTNLTYCACLEPYSIYRSTYVSKKVNNIICKQDNTINNDVNINEKINNNIPGETEIRICILHFDCESG